MVDITPGATVDGGCGGACNTDVTVFAGGISCATLDTGNDPTNCVVGATGTTFDGDCGGAGDTDCTTVDVEFTTFDTG
jgi:hypothetical protein